LQFILISSQTHRTKNKDWTNFRVYECTKWSYIWKSTCCNELIRITFSSAFSLQCVPENSACYRWQFFLFVLKFYRPILRIWNHITELCSKHTGLFGFCFSGKQNWTKSKTFRIRTSTLPQDFSCWECWVKTHGSQQAAEFTLQPHSVRYQHSQAGIQRTQWGKINERNLHDFKLPPRFTQDLSSLGV